MRSNGEWEEATIGFQLVHNESLQWAAGWIDGQHVLQDACAGCSWQRGLTDEARHRSSALGGQLVEDSLLATVGGKDVAIRQQGDCGILLLQETFVRHEHEGLFFPHRETNRPAELLAA